jgi:hypothetical protein
MPVSNLKGFLYGTLARSVLELPPRIQIAFPNSCPSNRNFSICLQGRISIIDMAIESIAINIMVEDIRGCIKLITVPCP